MRLLLAARTLNLESNIPIIGSYDEGEQRYLRYRTAVDMLRAQVYLISTEITKTVNSMPVPRHEMNDTGMPYDHMFVVYESSHALRGEHSDGHDEDAALARLISRTKGERIAVVHFGVKGHEPFLFPWQYEPKGVFPDDIPTEFLITPIRHEMAFLAFINSPYVDRRPARHPRHIRRELQKEGYDPHKELDTISVVTLRRKQNEQAYQEAASKRDFKHQWWVSGHIRAQWYPSDESHKLIWIDPYIKGPDGAPMIDKTYAVVR